MAFTLGTPVTAQQTGGGLPRNITLTIPGTTAGNALFVGIFWWESVSASISTITCAGETIVLHGSKVTSAANQSVQGASITKLATGGTKTVVITFTADLDVSASAIGVEVIGGDSVNFFDKTATNSAANTANPTVNINPDRAGSLIIGLCLSSNAETAGSAYTSVAGINFPGNPVHATTYVATLEYDVDGGSTGSRAVNFTSGGTPANDDWAIAAFAFRVGTPPPLTGGLTLSGAAPLVAVSSYGSGSLVPLRATGDAVLVSSPIMTGYATLEALIATGQASAGAAAFGYATLRKIRATGYTTITNVASLQPIRATGMWGNIIVGYGVLQPIVAPYRTGRAALERLRAAGAAQSGLSSTFVTKAMNTRTTAMTEYQNHPFNSYAFHNGRYLAAGAGGLYVIGGTMDGTTNIDWVVRTGQHDDKNRMLKKLPEVLLALRAEKAIRVRVYVDDSTYYDYTLPATKTDTIRQQRVKTGKGLRSRYFMIELQGLGGGYAEIDALSFEMIPTTRRIG